MTCPHACHLSTPSKPGWVIKRDPVLKKRGRVPSSQEEPWRLKLGGAAPLGSSPDVGHLPRGWHTAAWRPWPQSLFSKKGEEFVGSDGGVIYRERRKSPKSQGLTQRRQSDRALGPLPPRSPAWGLGAWMRLGAEGNPEKLPGGGVWADKTEPSPYPMVFVCVCDVIIHVGVGILGDILARKGHRSGLNSVSSV